MLFISLLNLFYLCTVFLIYFEYLSVFSCSLLSFLKTALLNSSLGNLRSSFLLYALLENYYASLVVPYFLDFFMFHEVVSCCLCIKKGSHHLQSLLTGFQREIPLAVSPARDSEGFSGFSYGCNHSSLLVHSWEGIFKIVCLLSILQILLGCS